VLGMAGYWLMRRRNSFGAGPDVAAQRPAE
jgi:hypothetical protein